MKKLYFIDNRDEDDEEDEIYRRDPLEGEKGWFIVSMVASLLVTIITLVVLFFACN